MVDEHFGLCLVEFMENFVPVVADDSGGPGMDIVRSANEPSLAPFGHLCKTDEDFISAMTTCLKDFNRTSEMRLRAYNSLDRFNDDAKFGSILSERLNRLLVAEL